MEINLMMGLVWANSYMVKLHTSRNQPLTKFEIESLRADLNDSFSAFAIIDEEDG